jgi:hypothetical protein
MLAKLKVLGSFICIKIHFLNTHLDIFPENLGVGREEQGERFHKDIKEMERRYQGRRNVNLLGDYCCMLYREILESLINRNRNIRRFAGKRK